MPEKGSVPTAAELRCYDLTGEDWREYEFFGKVYRIDNPVQLFLREGGTHHRVEDDSGIVHCLPGPGMYGCVLRWKNRAGFPPVQF